MGVSFQIPIQSNYLEALLAGVAGQSNTTSGNIAGVADTTHVFAHSWERVGFHLMTPAKFFRT
jgi:hypothetical protein